MVVSDYEYFSLLKFFDTDFSHHRGYETAQRLSHTQQVNMNNRTRVYAMGSKVIETACDQLGNINSMKSVTGSALCSYGLRMRPGHKKDPWRSYVEDSRASRTREPRLFLLGAAPRAFMSG